MALHPILAVDHVTEEYRDYWKIGVILLDMALIQ